MPSDSHPHRRPVKDVWLSEFGSPKRINRNQENKSHVLSSVRTITDKGEEEGENVVKYFMRGLDQFGPSRNYAPSDRVEKLCEPASLTQFQSEILELKGELCALLHDSSSIGEDILVRDYLGPLSADRLYHELKKEVSRG
jgi:hypothetical protein